jgi:hypothetical protein
MIVGLQAIHLERAPSDDGRFDPIASFWFFAISAAEETKCCVDQLRPRGMNGPGSDAA